MGGCAKQIQTQPVTYSEYYLKKVAAFEKENQNYTAGAVDVVFLGDSLTDYMDNKKFYPQWVTLNRGIAGDTTNAVEERLQVSLFDVQPKVVVMLIGINNLQTMFDDYATILQKMQTNLPNTKVVLLSLAPVDSAMLDWNAQIALSNVKIKNLAEEYAMNYVDIFLALYDFDNDKIQESYTTDGLHFSAAGYQVIVNIVTPYLSEFLG